MEWFKDVVPHTDPWWKCFGCWVLIVAVTFWLCLAVDALCNLLG